MSHRVALVLGSAACLWDDVGAFYTRLTPDGWRPDVVVACNEAGVHWPGERLHHWVTMHPEKLVVADPDHPQRWPWTRQREEAGYQPAELLWAHRRVGKADNVPETPWKGGSSGLLALQVGLMHADRAVLCGVPLDRQPHIPESVTHAGHVGWESADNHRAGWLEEKQWEVPPDRVRSMSGWTAERYGRPNWAWLGGIHVNGTKRGGPA